MHVGEFGSKDGRVMHRIEGTRQQTALLKTLQVPEPPRFLALDPAPLEPKRA